MRRVLKIYEKIQTKDANTAEIGKRLYENLEPELKEYIKNKDKIVLDFTEINSVTTRFLDNSICKMFSELGLNPENITFSELNADIKIRLKWSLNNLFIRNIFKM